MIVGTYNQPMNLLAIFRTPGLLLLLTLLSGLWLYLAGKPLNTAIFNLHKLIALGAVIVTGVGVNRLRTTVEFQGWLVVLVILLGVCVVSLFVSGALMSIGIKAYNLVRAVHNTATVVAALAAGIAGYLLVVGLP